MAVRIRSEPEGDAGSLSVGEIVALVSRNVRSFAIAVAVTLLACTGFLAVRPPVYRATATLLLDTDRAQGGILGDLALLARPPMAISEIEILRSRSLAERTVNPPAPATTEAAANLPLSVRKLGFTTLVDDESLRPLAQMFGPERAARMHAGAARLLASIERTEPGHLASVRVEFLSTDRIRLAAPLRFGFFDLGGPAAREQEYHANEPIEYEGIVLRLEAEGDLSGKRFLVRHVAREEAVARVLAGTRVAETSRNSGVIELSLDDSDPARAADIANALCQNYLERCMKRGEKRASQTVDFIEGQLAAQTAALSEAELEVVRLQQANPQTIDVGGAAEALIKELSELEVERVRVGLSRAALRETLALLEQGRIEAISRLGAEIADPLSAAYVEEIVALTSQSEQQDRNDTGAYKTLLQGKHADLRGQADALAIEIETEQATIADIERGDTSALARAGADRPGGSDPLTGAYLAQLAQLSGRLRDLELRFTPAHPDVARTEQEIDTVQSRLLALARSRLAGMIAQRDGYRALIDTYAQRLGGVAGDERARIDVALGHLRRRTREHLENRLAGLEATEKDLARELDRTEARLGELPESERVLANPKRRLEAHGEIVKFLLAHQQEAEISRASTVVNAEFIDTAVAPTRRHSPSVPLYFGGSLLLGLFFGLGLALLRESIDPRVSTSAELESAIGVPVFGAVPDFRRGRCRVAHAGEYFLALRDDPDGPIAEAYRSLRANLKFALGAEREIRTIACTSSTEGEGKSVTNCDVALAFALGERRVLLVDADMRRPTVQRYFELELAPGLAEILRGKATWQDCVRETEFANLHVITAGKLTSAPGDLLASSACAALIQAVRGAYDLVVFDMPPALAVADTEGLAAELDALVLLCRSRKLSRTVVALAADRLRSAGANVIGGILNADIPSSTASRYGYGYGYGYGPADSKKRSKRKAVGDVRAHS